MIAGIRAEGMPTNVGLMGALWRPKRPLRVRLSGEMGFRSGGPVPAAGQFDLWRKNHGHFRRDNRRWIGSAHTLSRFDCVEEYRWLDKQSLITCIRKFALLVFLPTNCLY